MYFEFLLNALLGPRIILHAMECSLCGHDEIYYIHPYTNKSIGKACKNCNFVQKFDFGDDE